MKLLTFYLPQFHEIPENNTAWGKGFTEWVNVKKARPLFYGHYQPREPLNKNFYNLLEKDTIKKQADMAKEYGVGGFCFYHYWFGSKRMVLEKPVEILLNDKSIDIPFCFSWANESWTKTWHGAGGEKEVLMQQRYEGEEDWNAHYEYFSKYFKDSRYIKVDNKPMLLIYRVNSIRPFNKMVDFWNRRAIEDGFDGIYIVSMLTSDIMTVKNKRISATVDFEPGKSRRNLGMEKRAKDTIKAELREKYGNSKLINRFICNVDDYDELNKVMVNAPHEKNQFRGAFVNYDDTPRRGNKGIIYKGSSPEKFQKYLSMQIKKSKEENKEFLFINAWNEWGEGNYLEPDERYGFKYLEAVRNALKKESGDKV